MYLLKRNEIFQEGGVRRDIFVVGREGGVQCNLQRKFIKFEVSRGSTLPRSAHVCNVSCTLVNTQTLFIKKTMKAKFAL